MFVFAVIGVTSVVV